MRVANDSTAFETAKQLSALEHVRSVCLIGSAARGEVESGSDIDLLAVVDARTHVKDVRRRVPQTAGARSVQTKVVDEVQLAKIFDGRSAFAVHVLREAVIVHDKDQRFAQLRAQHSLHTPVHADADLLRRKLEIYTDLDWCQGLFLYCLADCYSVGRASAYAILGQRGIFEFSANRALRRVAGNYKHLEPSAQLIARLRPFFLLASRDVHETLPFSYRGCRDEAEGALRAAHQLIGAVADDGAYYCTNQTTSSTN